jgi:DNA primase
VCITNPAAVMFPVPGPAKRDLVAYYVSVGDGPAQGGVRAAYDAAAVPATGYG